MGFPWDSNKEDKKNLPKPEDYEMCDICGKVYYFADIGRFAYQSKKTNTQYLVRCCRFCNPNTISQVL